MEHCKIEIKTHTRGTFSFYRAKGTFEQDERGVFVRYAHEGEAVELLLERDAVTMERESLSIRFERGKHTSARLRAAGHEGSLPLTTRFYSLVQGARSHSAVLTYELGEPAQKYSLSIRIDPDPEER